MNFKKLAVTGVLASSLVIGAGAMMAQDDDASAPDTQAEQWFRGPRGNRGIGPRGQFGPRGGVGFQGSLELMEMHDMVEEYTGLSNALNNALRDGNTLADLIEANGQSVDDFIAAVVADASERIDQAVADDLITETRAAALKEALVERVTARVNGDWPGRPGMPPYSDDAEAVDPDA